MEQPEELAADSGPGMRVERRERLVEQQDSRVPCQGTCEGDALTLTAGELVHANTREVSDAEAFEEVVHSRAVARAEAHVAEDIEVREERVLLEEVADPSLLGWDVMSSLGVEQHGLTDGDGARLRPKQTGDNTERRRLAGARRPDESQRFAARDGQFR
jgi:hypothetical protein